MSLIRIALIYDDRARPETTGGYCKRALTQLADMRQFRPEEIAAIRPQEFDLFLNIDDGLRYRLPASLRPAAWWMIDTHLDPDWYRGKARDFDFVFAAQQDAAFQFRRENIADCHWLPLACDPDIHRKHETDKQYDVSFVGNMVPGIRTDLLSLISRRYPRNFIGRCYFEEMARVYSASRVVFNRSVKNDLNMRVFEALACGSMLLTNALVDNGQEQLFQNGVHLETYACAEDLLDKLKYYLARDEVRERIGSAGRREAIAKHSYRQRMEEVLRRAQRSSTAHQVPADMPPCRRPALDTTYYDMARPDVLALVPETARRVLDIGCGAGALGASLKARQPVEVVGVELVPEAAGIARNRLDQVIVGDIESPRIDFPAGSFDCIICADVLEHLHDPGSVLRRLREWLDGGQLIASIPNVRHHSILASLLDGNWTYEPAGLLDDTHLHFFTLWDIEDLFGASGFAILQAQAVAEPGYDQWSRQEHPGNLKLGRLNLVDIPRLEAREFFAYQYLVAATPTRQSHEHQVIGQHALPRAPGRDSVEYVSFATLAAAQKTPVKNHVPGEKQCIRELGCVLAIRDRPADYLERTLQTFAYQTVQPGDRVLLDFGSRPECDFEYQQLCSQYGWRLVRVEPEEPRWILSEACNHAVAALDPAITVVFKSDVDVLLGQGVLELAFHYGKDRYCQFCCYKTYEGTHYPEAFRSHSDVLAVLNCHPPPHPTPGDGVHAYPRAWFERIGGFDLEYRTFGYEDHDLRLRAEWSIGVVYAKNVVLVHQWHPRPLDEQDVSRNREYFEGMTVARQVVRNSGRLVKGKGDPQSEEGTKGKTSPPAGFGGPQKREGVNGICCDAEAPSAMVDEVPSSVQRILWVGADAAAAGARLKRRQRAAVTELVPSEETDAGTKRDREHFLVSRVERGGADFANGAFDCVVLQSALDGTRHPDRVLRCLRDCLAADGCLVTEIPNTRHHQVISSLLHGTWSPGVRDWKSGSQCPLSFYTRREIEKLFYRAGFEIVHLVPASNAELKGWRRRGKHEEVQFGALHITGLARTEAEEFYTRSYLVRASRVEKPNWGPTSIVILTRNELPYTQMCLQSIRHRTDEPYELIVVDNGSTDGTVGYLRSQSDVRLIENSDNRGFPAGCNQGIRAATGEQILLLNNDVIVTTGWLHRLLQALRRRPQLGIVGPCSNCVSGAQQIPVNYSNLADLDGFAWEHGKSHAGESTPTDRIVGFCMLIGREVIERIGLLDERFGVGCFEDDDYCRRAAEAGYGLVIAWDAFVHHFGSRTFLGSGFDLAETLRRNERLFHSKWSAAEATPAGRRNEAPRRVQRLALEKSSGGSLRLVRTKVALSLCMIVRDNERTIEACLEGIRPWVDEMIVVDTGSRDATPEIARRCGAHVHRFPWCDDFSAARNESLKFAAGDWIFWMDSDDTISQINGRKLRALALDRAETAPMGYVVQVHCPGQGEADCTVVDHVKLFRNRLDLRFEGRIHEQILPSIRRANGEVVFTDIYVTHSGADHSAEARARKLERDFRLLELELAERPDHPFVLFNLGMTLADAGQHEKAVETLRRCIGVSHAEESHVRKAYALLTGSLDSLGLHEAAWETCQEGRRLCPDDAELLFREGTSHQRFGRLAEAERAYRLLLALGQPRYFSSVDHGIRGFKARHNLALVYDQTGELGKAEEQWREVLQEVPSYRAAWYGFGDVLLRQGKLQTLESLIPQIPQGDDPSSPANIEKMLLTGRVAAARGRLAEARKVFEEAVELAPSDREAGDCLCRLLFENGDLSAAETALREFLHRFPDDGAAHHNLGVSYLQQGHREKAIAELQESLRYRPDSPSTQTILEQLRCSI